MLERIKKHEGFRGYPYRDTKGLLTIGYGTLLPLSHEEATLLLEKRLNETISGLNKHLKWLKKQPKVVQEVVYEMGYQMGVMGVLSFKKTLALLKAKEYEKASVEMLDSKWARIDSPRRAKDLSSLVRSCA